MQKFIARQPILDAREKTFGYELLFRSGMENYFQSKDPDHASSCVIADSFLLFGMQTLTDGHRAFINFTRKLIVERCPTFLPADQLVIEILESVEPDKEVVSACQALHRMGYRFALDDFVFTPAYEPLLEISDFVKIDFLTTPPEERRRLAQEFQQRGIPLVAEKVESHDDFREAVDLGYRYFQGFFFSKPHTLSRRDIPAFKINYIRLLKAIYSPDPDFHEIEAIVKSEASLCFKLLRYLNSALFGFPEEIRSIRHALSLLGLRDLCRWVSLLALAGMCEDKPPALIVNTMTRARFCELLAQHLGMADRATDLFLTGLLSLVGAILDTPMPEILEQLTLSADVKAALTGQTDNRFRDSLDLVIAWEEGDWDVISRLSRKLGLEESVMADAHLKAVEWGGQVFRADTMTVAC